MPPAAAAAGAAAAARAKKKAAARIAAGEPIGNDDDDVPPTMVGKSLFCLDTKNPFRVACYWLAFHPRFDAFILVCILLNVVCMMIRSPVPAPVGSGQAVLYEAIDTFDLIVTIVFTIESGLKIVATSLVDWEWMELPPDDAPKKQRDADDSDGSEVQPAKKGKRILVMREAYLTDPKRRAWNQLDFMVVLSCWVAFYFENSDSDVNFNLSAFRALRALRPLKAIKSFKSMRAIMSALSEATGYLVNVITLLMFFFIVFGILGMQLFAGMYRNQCFNPVTNETGPICSTSNLTGYQCDLHLHAEKVTALSKAEAIASNYSFSYCRSFDRSHNPNQGLTSFDDIGGAWLLLFQLTTWDSWGELMYGLRDSAASEVVVSFFVLVIMLCSVLVLNMFIAVISTSFGNVRGQQTAEADAEKERKLTEMQLDGDEPKGCCSRFCGGGNARPCKPRSTLPLPSSESDLLNVRTSWAGKYIHVEDMDKPALVRKMGGEDFVLEPGHVDLTSSSAKKFYKDCMIEWPGRPLTAQDGVTSTDFSNMPAVITAQHLWWLSWPQPAGKPQEEKSIVAHYYIEEEKVFIAAEGWTYLACFCPRILALANIYSVDEEDKDSVTYISPAELKDLRSENNFYGTAVVARALSLAEKRLDVIKADIEQRMNNGRKTTAMLGGKALDNKTIFSAWKRLAIKNIQAAPALRRKASVLLQKAELARLEEETQRTARTARGEESEFDMAEKLLPAKLKVARTMAEKDLLDAQQKQAEWRRLFGLKALIMPTMVPQFYDVYVEDGFRPHGPGSCEKFGWWFSHFVKHPLFEAFIMTAIVANTFFLSAEYHDMPASWASMLEEGDAVFNYIFTFELLIKCVGMRGLVNYLKIGSNQFDFFIVSTSWIPVILSAFSDGDSAGDSGGSTFGALRVFRLFRVARLARLLNKYPDVRALLMCVFGGPSVEALLNLMFFIMFALSVFAILAMQLFGGAFWFSDGNPCTAATVDAACTLVRIDGSKGACLKMNATAPGVGTCYSQPRNNFDDFGSSILTLFVIMTGDSWTSVMYNGHFTDSGWAAVPFFIVYFVFSAFVLINLFVAVILENFMMQDDERDELQKFKHELDLKNKDRDFSFGPWKAAVRLKRKLSRGNTGGADAFAAAGLSIKAQTKLSVNTMRKQDDIDLINDPDATSSNNSRAHSAAADPMAEPVSPGTRKNHDLAQLSGEAESPTKPMSNTSSDQWQSAGGLVSGRGIVLGATANNQPGIAEGTVVDGEDLPPGVTEADWFANAQHFDRSCCIFKADNSFRKVCAAISTNGKFEFFIILMIFASSITLAMENPDMTQGEKEVLAVLDVVFLAIFWVEAAMKVVAQGFILAKNPYLGDAWNQMDFAVLLVATINYVPGVDAGFARILRIGRVLRPLRMINRNENMKMVVGALIAAMPSLRDVTILMLTLYSMFAILGLNLFSGQFWRCNDNDVPDRWSCNGTYIDPATGLNTTRVWANAVQNFDSFGAALVTLFEVSTMASWSPVMYNAMDANGVNMQPKTNASSANAVFFVLFILIGAFFVTQMFIGVIIDKYGKETGSALLSSEQMMWKDMKKAVMAAKPVKMVAPPEGNVEWFKKVRMACFQMSNAEAFNQIIMTCIMLNVIAMMCEIHDSTPTRDAVLGGINLFFVIIFTIEFVIKILGLGPWQYVQDSWNCFDGTIVVLSVLPPLIALFVPDAAILITVSSIARTFRIGRAARLIKRIKSLRLLFNTLVLSLPSMFNIGALFFLLLFVFAVLAVQMFALTCADSSCGATTLNRHCNFRSFGVALTTLFRMSTFDSWPGIRDDLHDKNVARCNDPDVQADPLLQDQYHCVPYPSFGTPFAIGFIIIGSFVFLQLVVAVILENFQSVFNAEDDKPLMPEDVERYKKVWKLFDPDSDGRIETDKLMDFLLMYGEKEVADNRDELLKDKETKDEMWRANTRLSRLPGIVVRMYIKLEDAKTGAAFVSQRQAYIGIYTQKFRCQRTHVGLCDEGANLWNEEAERMRGAAAQAKGRRFSVMGSRSASSTGLSSMKMLNADDTVEGERGLLFSPATSYSDFIRKAFAQVLTDEEQNKYPSLAENEIVRNTFKLFRIDKKEDNGDGELIVPPKDDSELPDCFTPGFTVVMGDVNGNWPSLLMDRYQQQTGAVVEDPVKYQLNPQYWTFRVWYSALLVDMDKIRQDAIKRSAGRRAVPEGVKFSDLLKYLCEHRVGVKSLELQDQESKKTALSSSKSYAETSGVDPLQGASLHHEEKH